MRMRLASSASKGSPVRIQRMASPQPATAGKRRVAPPKGRIPRATSICPNRVPAAATTTSLARASSIPSVRHVPCTARTTGLPTPSPTIRHGSTPLSGTVSRPPSGPRPMCGATSARSSPPVKWSPTACTTPTRSSGSLSSSPYALASSRSMRMSAALRLAGRSRPMSSRCPRRSTRTRGASSAWGSAVDAVRASSLTAVSFDRPVQPRRARRAARPPVRVRPARSAPR